MTTKAELQALLQQRLNVLHVELLTIMHSRQQTTAEKIEALHTAEMLAGAKMELQSLARFLDVTVSAEVEVARSDADDALYPSSETYEQYLRRRCCGCAQH